LPAAGSGDVVERGFDSGDFDLLASTGLLSVSNRRQESHRVRHPRNDVGVGAVVDCVGGFVRVVSKCPVARDAVHRAAHGDTPSVGPTHSVARTAQHDEIGANFGKHLVTDAHLLWHAGHHVGYDDIRNGNETFE